jgi:hypothetical protein
MTELEPSGRLLRRVEAARYLSDKVGLPCSPRTLAKLAVIGGGPLYRKASRVPLYEIADLEIWARSRIGGKQRSTSDVHSQSENTAQTGASR